VLGRRHPYIRAMLDQEAAAMAHPVWIFLRRGIESGLDLE